jgi:hypothetical protein
MVVKLVLLFFLILSTSNEVGLDFYYAISILMFIYYLNKMNKEFGVVINILTITIFFFLLQFLICPILHYELFENYVNEGAAMFVSPLSYMQNVVPLILALILGIEFGKNNLAYKMPGFTLDDQIENFKIGIELLFISYVSKYALSMNLPAFNFIRELFSLLNYVGLVYLFFSVGRWKNWFLFIAVLEIILFSLDTSFFADIIMFLPILYNFINSRFKKSLSTNYVLFIISFLLLIVFQSSKGDYRVKRNSIEPNKNVSSIDLFSSNVKGFDYGSSYEILMSNLGYVNNRLNQGWVQSGIIRNKSVNEIPFTLGDDLFGVFLPRFLFEGKVSAISMTKFALVSGIQVSEGTVFGLSVLGDVYGNFSLIAAVLVIFLIYFFTTKLFNTLYKFGFSNPKFIFWIPLVFFHFVRPGEDFFMTFNWIFKSIIFVFCFNFLRQKRYFN